jgi:hypothetical protein
MEPGRSGGLGPSAAAVLASALVAVVVVTMVSVGGGLNRPLVASSHPVSPATSAARG